MTPMIPSKSAHGQPLAYLESKVRPSNQSPKYWQAYLHSFQTFSGSRCSEHLPHLHLKFLILNIESQIKTYKLLTLTIHYKQSVTDYPLHMGLVAAGFKEPQTSEQTTLRLKWKHQHMLVFYIQHRLIILKCCRTATNHIFRMLLKQYHTAKAVSRAQATGLGSPVVRSVYKFIDP